MVQIAIFIYFSIINGYCMLLFYNLAEAKLHEVRCKQQPQQTQENMPDLQVIVDALIEQEGT